MADSTIIVDVVDKSVPALNPQKIAIINKPNPAIGVTVTGRQLLHLLQFPQYKITESATGIVINGRNIFRYFPELDPEGGGSSKTYTLISKAVHTNGTYKASDDSADGYRTMVVDVPKPVLVEKTIIKDGIYNPSDDGANGYSLVTVTHESSNEPASVIFYDYDGSVVASYTPEQFAGLTKLPANPTHEGLTSQGWNWSLSDAKSYVADYGSLNIGQMYVTSDGKTKLYITLTEGRTSPILQLYLNANSELDIDWGDGSTHSTFTTTTAGYVNERHNYSTPGDYVIAITVTTGSFTLQSSSTNVSSILWNGNNSTDSPDRAYNSAIKKIEIGTGVTSIGSNAFWYCYSLTSITIPDSVTSISDSAFYGCYSLSSITIPNSVTSIGQNTFNACYALSSITIPDSVTSIGNYAFSNCSSLSSITIPDSVTSIGSYAFAGCYSLSSIIIPNGVTSIGNGIFQYCSSLSSVTIPNGVKSIGSNAFQSCTSLSSITIPDGVTDIGSNAFQYCYALSSITIPNSVISIGSDAFGNCYSLSSITIGNSVTSIDNGAFQRCYSLTSITIPNSVKSINSSAFYNCYALTSVTIGNSVTSIDDHAFYNCSSLSSVTIPNGVKSIGSNAFQRCSSLSSITIGNSVKSIKTQAFYNCSYMESIKFTSTTPPTVANSNAWAGVSPLCIIYVPSGTLETYKAAANYPNPYTYTYIEY